MTLADLLDELQALRINDYTRDQERSEYAVRWYESEDEVRRVRIDHDTRTVWLDS